MPGAASARRYAQAAFQIALEKDELERWLDDLTLLADAVSNEDFLGFLVAPEIPASRKIALIKESLQGSVGPFALNMMSILATRNMAQIVPDIAEQFQRMLDDHRGIERAEVVSAVPLSDEQREKVSEFLKEVAGKDIRLTARVDQGILGGLVARVGDRVIDGSTRTKLRAMRLDVVQQVS